MFSVKYKTLVDVEAYCVAHDIAKKLTIIKFYRETILNSLSRTQEKFIATKNW